MLVGTNFYPCSADMWFYTERTVSRLELTASYNDVEAHYDSSRGATFTIQYNSQF